MRDLVPFLITAAALAAVMAGFAWLAARVRRRGLAGTAVRAALASYDEAFRTTAHESHYEIQAQAERKVPAPSPDGRWTRQRPEGPVGERIRRPLSPAPRGLRRVFGRWFGRRARRS
ncbi:hypothetical protein [Streptomyces marispadix]|uniref:Secreted protein n=1 Tax=Streptomyces marispadix TaxID=2922868 RepID=A0ABS9SVN3_9ACTN|nr:hypothetical protein [Streptomyces marispadix]MCH6160336.1 hypothetical protein [Streptomyces marispadix]